ncbi:DUF1816 domain-containing protein [Pleurocapsales cyanobacterium LEGE 06147]|nr:DUF1816 domain-containing protein [Pleurocapsales cyanobacterium LEGE 06147]
MRETLISVFNLLGWAWWIEINTQQPSCTYYFGPFLSQKEAFDAQSGYVEDLKNEGAQGIAVKFKRCKQPTELTIANDLGEVRDFKLFGIYSSQT